MIIMMIITINIILSLSHAIRIPPIVSHDVPSSPAATPQGARLS
jgi:hypothetical protein